MKTLTALTFVFVTGITMISFGHSHYTNQKVDEQVKDTSESEIDFDKRMEVLFASGVKGDPSKFELLIAQCDLQLDGELANLAKAWKANALILQSNPLFRSGNWQAGLKKWNAGLDLIKQADASDASALTKYRICSLCFSSWRHERDPQKKNQIAQRGLSAFKSFWNSDSIVWNRLSESKKLELQLEGIKAALSVTDRDLAADIVKSMTKFAPQSELTKSATQSLQAAIAKEKANPNAAKAPDKTSPRFDELVRADFFEGVFNDDPAAFKRAMDLCTSTLAKQPEHYEAMVWQGSGRLFESSVWDEKGDKKAAQRLWDEGMNLMHRACAASPDNEGVLIPRAATLISIGRVATMPEKDRLALLNLAVYDYQRTLELQKPYFARLSSHARGELLFGLADGWHQLGNKSKSDRFFKQVIETVPTSEQADFARMFLSGKIDKEVLSKRNCAGCH